MSSKENKNHTNKNHTNIFLRDIVQHIWTNSVWNLVSKRAYFFKHVFGVRQKYVWTHTHGCSPNFKLNWFKYVEICLSEICWCGFYWCSFYFPEGCLTVGFPHSWLGYLTLPVEIRITITDNLSSEYLRNWLLKEFQLFRRNSSQSWSKIQSKSQSRSQQLWPRRCWLGLRLRLWLCIWLWFWRWL